MEIRPRTLGEICDDAWRLALADAPLLLFCNALFSVPAFCFLLLLLATPIPSGFEQYVLPSLVAVFFPLMGLASGACQELFRVRTTGAAVGVLACLSAALRRGPKHVAARAILLCFTLPGPLLLMLSILPDSSPIVRLFGFLFGTLLTFVLSFPFWCAGSSFHVLLSTDAKGAGTLLTELRRDFAGARGKASVLVLSRLSLLLFLAVHLHLLGKVLFWAADNLAGFDTSLFSVQFVLFEEPIYTLALFQICWLLLSPFFEAGDFLLHTDIRTRQEGLDLQYRVQRAFGGHSSEPRATSSVLLHSLMLMALAFLLGETVVRADEAPHETIRAVRQEIETIRDEIQQAEPYPGGQRWQARLRGSLTKLERIDAADPRRFRWFEQSIKDFADRKKEDALNVLVDLERRLSLLEDSLAPAHQPIAKDKRSPEDIKSMLRGGEGGKVERGQQRQRIEEERPEVRREEAPKAAKGRAGMGGQPADAGPALPSASGGLSVLGWWLLGGLALAVVVLGIFLYLTSPRSPRRPKPETASGTQRGAPENDAQKVLEQSPASLWQQADKLADEGRFREAVRMTYLAVLALLHRQRLIRFEPMRTNGEYVRQVRLSELAPPELHEPFERLTHQFETAWYSERSCESGEYRSCRSFGEELQQIAGKV